MRKLIGVLVLLASLSAHAIPGYPRYYHEADVDECNSERESAIRFVEMRDQGASVLTVAEMVRSEMAADGNSNSDILRFMVFVSKVWQMAGTPKEISLTIYAKCMQGEAL